jgi:hypothetical protein
MHRDSLLLLPFAVFLTRWFLCEKVLWTDDIAGSHGGITEVACWAQPRRSFERALTVRISARPNRWRMWMNSEPGKKPRLKSWLVYTVGGTPQNNQ